MHSLTSVAKSIGVPRSTLRGRLKGVKTRKVINQEGQKLTPQQEAILESHIIFLCQLQCIPTSQKVMNLATKILRQSVPSAKPLTSTWLTLFYKRSRFLVKKKRGVLDLPRVRESGDRLIHFYRVIHKDLHFCPQHAKVTSYLGFFHVIHLSLYGQFFSEISCKKVVI